MRSVFYGFGAVVGSLTGPSSCTWWPDDPVKLGWVGASQVPVDLSKNPEAARRGIIPVDEIQADDHFTAHGGLTQIGPKFPGGRMTGGCWLESTYWNGLPNKPPRAVPDFHGFDYELTSVLYWDGELAGRRFIGVHARIQSTANQGTFAMVDIWNQGTSQSGHPPAGTWWIDLAQQHVLEPGFTAITSAGQAGALFIDSKLAGPGGAIPLAGPKIPIRMGGAVRPRAPMRIARRSA